MPLKSSLSDASCTVESAQPPASRQHSAILLRLSLLPQTVKLQPASLPNVSPLRACTPSALSTLFAVANASMPPLCSAAGILPQRVSDRWFQRATFPLQLHCTATFHNKKISWGYLLTSSFGSLYPGSLACANRLATVLARRYNISRPNHSTLQHASFAAALPSRYNLSPFWRHCAPE